MSKKTFPRIDDVGVDFLRTEVQAGLTFAKVAATTSRPAARKRNQQNATTALEAVMKFKTRVALSVTEYEELENGLADLREAIAAISAAPSRGARAPARSRRGPRGSEKAS